ncbi:MAG: flagellar export chaperone FlgN [Desulfuromonadaceae bacterium]|nr:flagellar export chaperone FlgN [Desulfuromonadaceae bacterium]
MPQIRKAYEYLSELGEALLDMRILLLKEREDIVNLNLSGLSERRNSIEKLSGHIRELNGRTSALISIVCQEAGITDEMTLSALITLVPKPDREQFVLLQKTILRVSTDVDNAIRVNSGILEDSLAFSNQSMTTFAGLLKNSSTYGQAGRYVETVDRSRIINREI